MDQNVIRTDLLPETMEPWLIGALALFGVVCWVFCHFAVRRWLSNRFNVWGRALASVPVGVAASWLALQFLARVFFLATPWPLFLAAIVAAVSIEAVCAFYVHECARVPPRTGRLLVACRVAAVSTVLLVLMQPVLVGERERTVSKRVLVLVDDSASMHFPDRQLTDAERADVASALGMEDLPPGGMTRAEMVRGLMAAGGDGSFLSRVARRYAVDVFRFGNGIGRGLPDAEDLNRPPDAKEETFRSATDITRALELALQEVPAEEIASVVLFTDGRHNGDAGVESVARRLGGYGIAVSTVVVGGTVKPFDVSISAADCRESVFLGDKVRFTVRVSATRANGRRGKVVLAGDGGDIDERDFVVEGDEWSKEFKFADVPKEKGVYRYRISATRFDGELFADNNERELDVAVSDDRTNVLLVDGRPRWEYRYLRNLFYGRDKSVHLQDWLVHPDRIAGVEEKPLEFASAARAFGDSEAGGFPFDLDAWRQFDVIIIGDIGEDLLTEEVVERIRYCVEERGALLVLVSGSEFMPYGIRNKALRDLMPVEYTPSPGSRREAPEGEFRFALAPAGRGHAVMNQSSSPSENEEIWGDLPDFRWRLPVDGVKPGAEVLAYAKPKKASGGASAAAAEIIAATIEEDPETALKRLEEMRGEQSRNALITAVARGRGRVLMLTTDSMWRLRNKNGDELHHRFWGQVMRWGAGERMRAGNNHVRIGTDQLRYGAGEPVKAYMRCLDDKFNGMDGLRPRLCLREPGGDRRGRAFSLEQRPDSCGFYECEIPGCDKPGTYTLTLECNDAQDRLGRLFPVNLSTSFVVVTAKQPAEEVDITATSEHAERIAAATGGRVLKPSEYVRLDEDFGGGTKRVADRVEYQLWSLPPLFLLVVALLTLEWITRKRASLA